MPTTIERFQHWLAEPEGVRLEFKEAKQNYHFGALVKYCVALANEGGGKIILGVTDRRPRHIVGTAAFAEPGRTEAGLYDQGMNLMFESAIRQGKALPSFAGTSAREVRLTLHGAMTSPAFVRFIERLGEEKLKSFSTYDFLVLDYLRRDQAVPDHLKVCLPGLVAAGAVESIGRGRGVRYLLARSLYAALGGKGVYTRKKGLDRETNKALLLKHIQDNAATGSQMDEFRQVLPALVRSQIQVLLRELRKDQRVHKVGNTKAARWFPGAAPTDCNLEASVQ